MTVDTEKKVNNCPSVTVLPFRAVAEMVRQFIINFHNDQSYIHMVIDKRKKTPGIKIVKQLKSFEIAELV